MERGHPERETHMLKCVLPLVFFLSSLQASAQEAFFLIRHAEKAEGNNPPITEAGRERAARWAVMLADAGVGKVFTSTARRTMETGDIIADALGVETEALAPDDIASLMDLLSFDHEDDRILIVGHTETIPHILTELGAFDLVDMPDEDFARLFAVFPNGGEPVIVDMRMP